MERLKKHAGVSDAEFNDILLSHAVNPEFMYSDDFNKFFHIKKSKYFKKSKKQ